MAPASELPRFSSSFLFNLLLMYTFDICMRQPCGLLPPEPLRRPGFPVRPAVEAWRTAQVTELLRPRGVRLQTHVTAQITSLPGAGTLTTQLSWMLGTQWLPIHAGSGASVLRACVRVRPVHAHRGRCCSPASVWICPFLLGETSWLQ